MEIQNVSRNSVQISKLSHTDIFKDMYFPEVHIYTKQMTWTIYCTGSDELLNHRANPAPLFLYSL